MNRTEENLQRIRSFSCDNEGRMAFDDWDESKHPRRPDGKFGSCGGAKQESVRPNKTAQENNDDVLLTRKRMLQFARRL